MYFFHIPEVWLFFSLLKELICTTQWTKKTWHFIFDYNFG